MLQERAIRDVDAPFDRALPCGFGAKFPGFELPHDRDAGRAIASDAPDTLVMIGEIQAAIGRDSDGDERELNAFAAFLTRVWLRTRQRLHGGAPTCSGAL